MHVNGNHMRSTYDQETPSKWDHQTSKRIDKCLTIMEPLVGFEPTTYSLRMNCSTPELQRRLLRTMRKKPKSLSTRKR